MGWSFLLGVLKCSNIRAWRCLYISVDILNASEPWIGECYDM